MLIDTNGDNVPDSREFAGSHRYNTAVALAERFAADEGSISTVIIASGESQVDAVTAAGLAGNLNAAVLLTRSNQLPHNVARFIDEQNVTDVIVVGGTAAVPDAIVTAIESLGSRPSVERISGADRYATAAAIGDRLGGPNPTWCGSSQSAAILVNGGEDGRADAVISGPLAFRLGLPILLTTSDEVPEATASFLTDNKVERVVVVGGMGAVSDGVVNDLVENVGVVNVQRISGGSAAATSVMVAKEMLGNCAAVLQTNPNLVALVNRDAIADGITAAPVLGRGLEVAGSVPILLVSDDLPAAVNDYLASTAEVNAAGNKTHLNIVAIGGTAVVSDSVMADAVAAAKTSSMLTATITPLKYHAGNATATHPAGSYRDTFTVSFSDDVKEPTDADGSGTVNDSAADRRGTVLDPTLYRLNGRRLQAYVATTPDETGTVQDLIFTANRTVTIKLSHHLEPGDTISVVGGGKIGDNDDQRKLESASLTLGAVTVAADRSAPVVEIVAVPGQTNFEVFVFEQSVLHNELAANFANFIEIQGPNRPTSTFTLTAPTAVDPTNRKGVALRYQVGTTAALAVNDVITIQRSAVIDTGGRRSALTRHTVRAVKNNIAVGTTDNNVAGTGHFEVQSVSIGDYVHGTQATADISTDMDVLAKATGIASGARGNSWTIFGFDDRAQGQASTNAFDIRVAVDTANQRISYTISDVVPARPHRQATIGDLAAALVSNDDFNANFALQYEGNTRPTAGKGTPLTATSSAGVGFTGGMSSVGVVVRFNDAVQDHPGTTLEDAIRPSTSTVTGTVTFTAPDNQVHISYTAASMAALPARSGFRVIPAGAATNYHTSGSNNNIREILNSLRPDASIKP